MYIAAEADAVPFGDAAGRQSKAGGLFGSGPPAGGSEIAWRMALLSAMQLAIPAGVLCSGLTPIGQQLGLIWMIGASAWAVRLYAQRAQVLQPSNRLAGLTMGMGARIGLVTGLMASWLTLSLNGATLWVARNVLHQGSQMDGLWAADVERSLELSHQMVLQMGLAAAQAEQSTQMSRAWMLSAEGRAGIALSTLLFGAGFLALFAAIGGAMGARFLVPTRRPGL